jgi:hypothetical protein
MNHDPITGPPVRSHAPSDVSWQARRLSGRYTGQLSTPEGPVSLVLHVDIDGPKPQGIVSGTLHEPGRGEHPIRFLQPVAQRASEHGTVTLEVGGLSVQPRVTPAPLSGLEIRIKPSTAADEQPRAVAQFIGPVPLGPIDLQREGPWFRTVELQVDHESGATMPLPPYSSLAHPDRPRRLVDRQLSLQQAFADAGIRIVYSGDSKQLDTSAAGDDHKWSQRELHDAMTANWDAYANRPQWKMWVLIANLADNSGLGGLMFDTNIAEPGGVDRQGMALFTHCEYFFSPAGLYCTNNQPAQPAAQREMFFTLVHEIGHAFNLVHPAERKTAEEWSSVAGLNARPNRSALTFMNYPNLATPNGLGAANASWFYRRFGFTFEGPELVFLRHAPDRDVEMGGKAWGSNNARLGLGLEPRLRLQCRSRRQSYELGERVIVELKLQNVGTAELTIHDSLHPSEGFVQVGVTDPDGRRRIYKPLQQAHRAMQTRQLPPGHAIYKRVDLSVGLDGFAFKQAGRYRVDASYVNVDGRATRADYAFRVSAASSQDEGAVRELFSARVGRVLYVDGTRYLEDVNEKLDWVRAQLGNQHPASIHLATVRFSPMAHDGHVLDAASGVLRRVHADPERAMSLVHDLVGERASEAADTLGHIGYRRLVERYTGAAQQSGRSDLAKQAHQQLIDLLGGRGVPPSVLAELQSRQDELNG